MAHVQAIQNPTHKREKHQCSSEPPPIASSFLSFCHEPAHVSDSQASSGSLYGAFTSSASAVLGNIYSQICQDSSDAFELVFWHNKLSHKIYQHSPFGKSLLPLPPSWQLAGRRWPKPGVGGRNQALPLSIAISIDGYAVSICMNIQMSIHIQYTIYNIKYTICNIQYTIYSIQYTIYNIHIYICTYIHIYIDIDTCIHVYIYTYITLHYITLHYITLHYIYITLHYITLH